MRILMTTDVAGGVWSYTEELVDGLVARGHDLALVVLGGHPTAAQERWLSRHPGLPVSVLPCPLEWMPEPEPGLSESIEPLRRVVRRVSPDVVHLNQFYYGAYDLGRPSVVVGHSDVVSWWRHVKAEEPPDDAWFRRYREWVARGLQGASACVAPTAWLAKQLESTYGATGIRVIYNARTPDRFRGRRRGPRRPVVVSVGRWWDDAKGARDLVEAAAILGGRPGIILAGPVIHPGGGKDFPIEAAGLEWRGILDADELRRMLAEAMVYAAPSHYEPFGLAPLEAALAGCALVLSDLPTFRELWDGCARFYPAGDAEALARAIQDLIGDPATCRALAEVARTRALDRYSPARMAREYELLYREAMCSPSPRMVPAR